MIVKTTAGRVRPSPGDLAGFGLRESGTSTVLGMPRSGAQDADADADGDTDVLPEAVLTFLFREEEPSASHILLAERTPGPAPIDCALRDLASGEVVRPTRSEAFGTTSEPVTYTDAYIGRYRPSERVRLYWFKIPRRSSYGYLVPSISGPGHSLLPREMAVVPRSPVQEPVPTPQTDVFEQSGDTLVLRRPVPTVHGEVVIPHGLTWRVTEPTILRIGRGGGFTIHGDLHVDEGVRLTLTAAEPDRGWSGIHFFGGGNRVVRNLSVVAVGDGSDVVTLGGRAFTGGLTVHDARVRLENVEVREMRVEDGIHLVRSESVMERVAVDSVQSDGVDVDFGVLVAGGLDIERCGGDAIDVSGALLHLASSRLVGSQDKNLSVGENSRGLVSGCDIDDAPVGIAVKDASSLVVERCRLRGNGTGIAAYSKKIHFERPSYRLGDDVLFERNETDELQGPPSSLAHEH